MRNIQRPFFHTSPFRVNLSRLNFAKTPFPEIRNQAENLVRDGLRDTKTLALALRIPLLRAIQTHFDRLIARLDAQPLQTDALSQARDWRQHFTELTHEADLLFLSHIFRTQAHRQVEAIFGKIENAVHFYQRGNLVMSMGKTGTPTEVKDLVLIDREIYPRWQGLAKDEGSAFEKMLRISCVTFGIGHIKYQGKKFPSAMAQLYFQGLGAMNRVLLEGISAHAMQIHLQGVFQTAMTAMAKRK